MIKSKGERENERQEKEITPHPPTEINEMDVQVSIIPFHSILFHSLLWSFYFSTMDSSM